MNDSNRHHFIIRAGGAATALLLAAGLAVADVPNDEYVLTNEKTKRNRAHLDIEDSSYHIRVGAECGPFSDTSDSPDIGSLLEVSSTHPDSAQLKNNQGDVEQSRKGNLPTVRLVTGSGDGELTNYLLCDKAEVEGQVKTKKTPSNGSFEASGKKCVCAETDELESEDCTKLTAQINRLVTDCQNNKAISISYSDGTVKKFKIKGKGEAFLAEDTPDP